MDHILLFTSGLIIIPLIGYIAYKFSTRNFNYWKDRNVPYMKPIPYFGNIVKVVFFRRGIGFQLTDLYNQMKERFVGIFVFNQPALVIKDPELIKRILVKDFDYFRDRTVFSDVKVDSMSANFLFFSKGDAWKTIRTKTSPVFTSGKLKNMSSLIEQVAENMNDYIKQRSSTVTFEDGKEICTRYSMDVLATCAFGVDAGCFKNKNADFYQIGRRIFGFNVMNSIRFLAYFIDPLLIKFTKLTLLDPYVNKFIREVLGATITEREKNNYKRNDLVDYLVEFKKSGTVNGVTFEGDTLLAQAGQFFVAGHETVATTMSFALYELCLHPEIQHKLRKEIASVLKSNGKLDYETVHKLPYLDQVVKETLRKYPVLPYLDRKCVKEYQIPDTDIILDPGTYVYIPMYGLHYDAKYFPNPEKFDPERFSEENRNNIPSSVYIPFGYGPRICLGERFGLTATKVGIAHLFAEYEIQKCEKTPDPVEFDTKAITIIPTTTLYMKFKRSPTAAA